MTGWCPTIRIFLSKKVLGTLDPKTEGTKEDGINVELLAALEE
jgi:hypothetical protein